jgi:hypothetical protein
MESLTQSEYSDKLFRLTQLEDITGINYIAQLGAYAIQLELPYAILK